MKKLGVIVAILVFFGNAFGQYADSSKKYRWWLDAGIGGFNTKSISGDTYGVGLTIFNDKTFYTIQFLRNEEPEDYIFTFGPLPFEKYSSIDVMIGKGISNKYLQIQASGGLGMATGIRRGAFLRTEHGLWDISYYEEDRFTVPSLPLEVDFMVKPTKWLGVGLGVFGNFNSARSYSGYQFKLSLGRLR